MNQEEILARTLWGEARGEGQRGLWAVANVIVNRARRPGWWGHDVASVCLARRQFSCWNSQDPNHALLLAVTARDSAYKAACALAEKALEGTLADITHGATSYYATTIAPPAWAVGKTPCLVLGKHVFFAL